MSNETPIIQNRVKEKLETEGRTREWLQTQMIHEGLFTTKVRMGQIINSSQRSITLDELVLIAHILDIKNPMDLIMHGLVYDQKLQRLVQR